MGSIFSKIIRREVPAHIIAENDDFLAFLDAFPLREGHTLVVPKKEVDYIFDLEKQDYSSLMDFSRTVALAVRKAIPCERISMQVIGLEVPHAHVHLIPINSMRDCDFSRPKLKFSPKEFEETAARISAQLTL